MCAAVQAAVRARFPAGHTRSVAQLCVVPPHPASPLTPASQRTPSHSTPIGSGLAVPSLPVATSTATGRQAATRPPGSRSLRRTPRTCAGKPSSEDDHASQDRERGQLRPTPRLAFCCVIHDLPRQRNRSADRAAHSNPRQGAQRTAPGRRPFTGRAKHCLFA